MCTHSNGTQYNFNQYRDINQFGRDIYSSALLIEGAKDKHYEMQILINKLNNYGATNPRKVQSKKKVLESTKRL